MAATTDDRKTCAWDQDPAAIRWTRAKLEEALAMNGGPEGLELAGADLSGQNLSGMDLHGIILSCWEDPLHRRCANLEGAHLKGADLRGAQLGGVDLHKALLRGANLCRAKLEQANLEGAVLEEADLREAFPGLSRRDGSPGLRQGSGGRPPGRR